MKLANVKPEVMEALDYFEVWYNGQMGFPGSKIIYLFTDKKTKGTFSANDPLEFVRRLHEIRLSFE